MAKVIPTVDGIPVIPISAPRPPEEVDKKPLETAQDALGSSPPSRLGLRISAAWWRSLQYVGMTMHFLAPPRPPNQSFTKTIPSTISKTKGSFTLQFYTPAGYEQATTRGGTKFPAVVNFHGGGFTLGSATDDARFARFVLEDCNAVFVSVDYRLSPENPFPVAVEDAADALLYVIRFAADLHIDPFKLAVSGFSAGANLALTAPLCLAEHLKTVRASGLNVPDHCIRATATWYPTTDYTVSRAVKRANSVRPDQTLPDMLTSLFDASYLHPPSLRLAHPWLSPSKASDEELAVGIPERVIFYTCEWDMLLKEGELFAKRLGSAPINKDVRYKMIPGVPHAWDKSPDPTKLPPGAEELYRECCRELREAFEME
jgi:acetyl esterase/lipase